MKKYLLLFSFFFILTMSAPFQTNAADNPGNAHTSHGVVTETRYQFMGGTLYRRKYNTTHNIWLGNWTAIEDAATQNNVNLRFKRLKPLPGNKVKLVWSRSDYVDGYEIYRHGLKWFKKIKTVGSYKGTCRNRNLKTGVRYKYKIRAYKIVDGEIYYSKFSKIKSVLF